jgi:uncharacterized OB-fold protein
MSGVIVQRCAGCGLAARPPRLRCSSCGSVDLAPASLSSHGTVFSSTTDGLRQVVLVELDSDGLRLLALDPSGSQALPIGAAVTVSEADGQLLVTRSLDD